MGGIDRIRRKEYIGWEGMNEEDKKEGMKRIRKREWRG